MFLGLQLRNLKKSRPTRKAWNFCHTDPPWEMKFLFHCQKKSFPPDDVLSARRLRSIHSLFPTWFQLSTLSIHWVPSSLQLSTRAFLQLFSQIIEFFGKLQPPEFHGKAELTILRKCDIQGTAKRLHWRHGLVGSKEILHTQYYRKRILKKHE